MPVFRGKAPVGSTASKNLVHEAQGAGRQLVSAHLGCGCIQEARPPSSPTRPGRVVGAACKGKLKGQHAALGVPWLR